MGVVLTRDAHERMVSAVRWVEANRRGPQPPAAGPRVSVSEAITCRVTSATVDGDGRYPAVITLYDPTAGTWSDYSAVKLQPMNAGTALLNGFRYLARPAGRDGADEVYIATQDQGLVVEENDGSPSVSETYIIRVDQAQGGRVTAVAPANIALISWASASATDTGVVSTASQSFSGVKNFLDGIWVDADAGIVLVEGAVADGYGHILSATAGDVTDIDVVAYAPSGSGAFGLINIASAPVPGAGVAEGAVCRLQAYNATDGWVRASYAVLDPDDSDIHAGQWATTGGLTFKGGLYTSGTLSVSGISWSGMTGTNTTGTIDGGTT